MTSRNKETDTVRKEKILDAALHCFLHFGFAKTTLDDVAKKAGISRPLIYLTFKNKGDLFDGVLAHLIEGRIESSMLALNEKQSKKEKLLKVCDILLVEPWQKVSGFPMSEDFYERCSIRNPAVIQKNAENFIACVQQILGDKTAGEVFFYATEGLHADVPNVEMLCRRLAILADKFTQ